MEEVIVLKRKLCISAAVLLLFCMGVRGEVWEQHSDVNSNYQMVMPSIQKETKSEKIVNKDQFKVDDGVYRSYSLGTTLQAGTVVNLNASLLLNYVEELVKTAVFLNGDLYKMIEFSGEDEKIELDVSGNYWVIVIDNNQKYVDITDEIDYLFISQRDSILFLS